MPNLTDLSIRSLPEGLHFDSKLPSFGIRVGKHRKTWVVVKGKNRTKVKLGLYPSLSLAEARRVAHAVLGTPHIRRDAPAFPEALQSFLAQDHWRASTRYTVEKCLQKHFTWTKPIDKITHHDVLDIIDRLPDGAASEAVKNIRAFFNWCVPRYLDHSPCVGLKKPTYTSRSRVLTDDEIKALWKATEKPTQYNRICRLLLLTGQRRGEIAALRAEWIRGDTITLPLSICKNGREHTFPLGTSSSSIFSTLPSDNSQMLFPARGSKSTPFNGWSKSKAALDKASGIQNWTLHDLRRTFATKLASLGVAQPVTEKLLNHVSGIHSGVSGIYNRHSYFEEMKAAIALYERHLLAIVSERPPGKG